MVAQTPKPPKTMKQQSPGLQPAPEAHGVVPKPPSRFGKPPSKGLPGVQLLFAHVPEQGWHTAPALPLPHALVVCCEAVRHTEPSQHPAQLNELQLDDEEHCCCWQVDPLLAQSWQNAPKRPHEVFELPLTHWPV